MSTSTQPPPDSHDDFFLAAFCIDGRQEGIRGHAFKRLSPKWLEICSELLDELGPVFNHTWLGPLSHIRTAFTSARGVALCTVYVQEEVAATLLIASGRESAAEREALSMFVQSLRDTPALQEAATVPAPFADAFRITERPLVLTVPIPSEEASDLDHDLVRELSLHLSAAFLADQAAS